MRNLFSKLGMAIVLLLPILGYSRAFKSCHIFYDKSYSRNISNTLSIGGDEGIVTELLSRDSKGNERYSMYIVDTKAGESNVKKSWTFEVPASDALGSAHVSKPYGRYNEEHPDGIAIVEFIFDGDEYGYHYLFNREGKLLNRRFVEY